MNAVTLSSDITQIILAILATGYTIYFIRNVMYRTRMQVEYENTFLNHHETAIIRQQRLQNVNDYIQLTFPQRDQKSLVQLCRQCRSKCSPHRYLTFYEPKIEIHYLRLRRLAVARKPVRTEVILCSQKYALVGGGEGSSDGYILEIDDDANVYNNVKIFHMFAKFQHKQKPTSGSELPSVSRHGLLLD